MICSTAAARVKLFANVRRPIDKFCEFSLLLVGHRFANEHFSPPLVERVEKSHNIAHETRVNYLKLCRELYYLYAYYIYYYSPPPIIEFGKNVIFVVVIFCTTRKTP